MLFRSPSSLLSRLGWETGAVACWSTAVGEKLRGPRTVSYQAHGHDSRDQLHVVVVATVLRGQRGALVGQHGADAEAGGGLVDVQAFFGAAGVAPPVRLAVLLVGDVDGAVDGLGGVAARASCW